MTLTRGSSIIQEDLRRRGNIGVKGASKTNLSDVVRVKVNKTVSCYNKLRRIAKQVFCSREKSRYERLSLSFTSFRLYLVN